MKKELALIGALVALMAKLAYGLRDVADLGDFIEAGYRAAARAWFWRGQPLQADWGPFYSWWLLVWDLPLNPVPSYYFNQLALFFSAGLVVYLVARRLTTPMAAFFSATMVSLLQFNLAMPNKLYLFAALFTLLFVAGAFAFSDERLSCAIAGVGLATASFVLPEFGVGLALFLFFSRKTRYVFAAPAIILAWLIPTLGNPWRGGQIFTTFSQQFTRRWCTWYEPGYPWELDYLPKWKQLFPGVTSVAEAVARHPAWLLRYFAENLVELPVALYRAIFSLQIWPDVGVKGLTPTGNFVALLLAFSLIVGRTRLAPFFQHLRQRAWPLVSGLVAVAVPSLANAVLTYPEPTALLPAAIVFWIFTGAWLAYVAPQVEFAPVPWLPSAAVVGVALLITPFTRSPWNHDLPPDRPNLRMHNALSRLELKSEPLEIVVADDYRGFSVYQSPRWVRLPPWERTTPFFTFLETKDVSILVTHPGQPFLPQDQWQAFEREPQRWGYHRVPVHRHSSIYVKKDRLVSSPTLSAR